MLKKNRFMLLALSILLMLSILPLSAFAQGDGADIGVRAASCGDCNRGYIVPFTTSEEIHDSTTACNCSSATDREKYRHYNYRTRTTTGNKCTYCTYEKSSTTTSSLKWRHVLK